MLSRRRQAQRRTYPPTRTLSAVKAPTGAASPAGAGVGARKLFWATLPAKWFLKTNFIEE